MNVKQMLDDAKRTGRLWMGGEMEIPFPCYFRDAVHITNNIAEQCGYLALPHGSSRLEIHGGDIPGYIVLDWFHGDQLGPEKVELWTCEAAYADLDNAQRMELLGKRLGKAVTA